MTTTTALRNRRLRTVVASVAAGLLALAACSAAEEPDADPEGTTAGETVRVGAIYLDSQGYYGGVKAGVEAAADASGLDVEFIETNPGGDVAQENEFMNTLASSGVDAIIISAASTDSSVPAIRQASEAGIPVICYNTCVNDEAVDEYVTSYVIGDPVQFGQMLGEAAAEWYADQGIDAPRLGVVNCEQYEVCQLRLQGFVDALTEALPATEVVANQEGAEVDRAVPVAEQILTANSDINGMYGEAGGATVGAFSAVDTEGRADEIGVFGSDMTTEIATELESGGALQAVVDISGIEVGTLAWDAVRDALEGTTPDDPIIPAPITLYRPEDAAQWLETHPDGLP